MVHGHPRLLPRTTQTAKYRTQIGTLGRRFVTPGAGQWPRRVMQLRGSATIGGHLGMRQACDDLLQARGRRGRLVATLSGITGSGRRRLARQRPLIQPGPGAGATRGRGSRCGGCRLRRWRRALCWGGCAHARDLVGGRRRGGIDHCPATRGPRHGRLRGCRRDGRGGRDGIDHGCRSTYTRNGRWGRLLWRAEVGRQARQKNLGLCLRVEASGGVPGGRRGRTWRRRLGAGLGFGLRLLMRIRRTDSGGRAEISARLPDLQPRRSAAGPTCHRHRPASARCCTAPR